MSKISSKVELVVVLLSEFASAGSINSLLRIKILRTSQSSFSPMASMVINNQQLQTSKNFKTPC
jgi:hypothetical protein